MILLLFCLLPYTIGTPRPFERYLNAPVLVSVSGTEPAGLFITWHTERADDRVLGFKIKLWSVDHESETRYELINAEEYPGYVYNLKPSKSLRMNETSDIPEREIIVEKNSYMNEFHIQNLDYNTIYEVRVLAYKIDQESPMSEPIRIKLVKVREQLGTIIRSSIGCSFTITGEMVYEDAIYPHEYISYI